MSHTSRIAAARWRLASLIAPSPIVAAPLTPGSAILIRDKDRPGVAWITPASLNIESHVDLALDKYALGNYAEYTPGKRTGTITGSF